MNRPVVSVIVIFWNEGRHLDDAIRSVQAQTLIDWELLLVDDGSTDDSPAIAACAVAADPQRVRLLTHPGGANRGMSASRNLGIAAARGEYVTFLDGDDLLEPTKFIRQSTLLAAHPEVGFVASPARYWFGHDGRSHDRDFVQRLLVRDGRVEAPELVVDYLRDEWRSLCDLMIRREAIHACGGYEDAFTGMFEDQVFHAKLASTHAAWITGDCWYWYRQHADTSTSRSHRDGGHRAARRRFLRWLRGHVQTLPSTVRSPLEAELKVQRRELRKGALPLRVVRRARRVRFAR